MMGGMVGVGVEGEGTKMATSLFSKAVGKVEPSPLYEGLEN